MKDWLGLIILFLIIGLFIFGIAEYEIWRWHTFQETFHSDISFWKYQFLFGGEHK
jgi:hypothetical protein